MPAPVFIAEFQADPGRTLDEFFCACHQWLTGSPHYPFKDLPPLVPVDGAVVELQCNGSHHLAVALAHEEGRSLGGVRHVWTESGQHEWVTQVIAVEDLEGLWVSITLFCNLLIAGEKPPQPKKPYVVKVMFERLGGGQDGELVVQDRPRFLKSNDLELAARAIEGACQCRLPIVYASVDFNGYPFVDVDNLARHLSGLAHVLVEPNRSFSIALARRTASRNPYGGAVGIFWLRGNASPSRLLPNYYASQLDLCIDVEKRVRAAWLFAKSDRDVSWLTILQAISARKLEKLRSSLRAEGDQRLDEFAQAFDEDNRNLRDQVADLQAKNSYLRRALDEAQTRLSSSEGGLLKAGSEQDFYPGEASDAVLTALRESLTKLSQDSRYRLLVEDILSANELSDTPQRLEQAIRKTLENAQKVGAREISELEAVGFAIKDEGKHIKASFHGDPRYSFTIHKTASDYRASKNITSEIIRRLFRK